MVYSGIISPSTHTTDDGLSLSTRLQVINYEITFICVALLLFLGFSNLY